MEQKDGLYSMHLRRTTPKKAAPAGGDGDLVILITTNLLGGGSEELGETLMKSYLYALTESSVKPKTLIFMNAGVFLTVHGSPVLDSLAALEGSGVEIISCGACLNFYSLEAELAIGSVSNMYDFAVRMNNARNTIKL